MTGTVRVCSWSSRTECPSWMCSFDGKGRGEESSDERISQEDWNAETARCRVQVDEGSWFLFDTYLKPVVDHFKAIIGFDYGRKLVVIFRLMLFPLEDFYEALYSCSFRTTPTRIQSHPTTRLCHSAKRCRLPIDNWPSSSTSCLL